MTKATLLMTLLSVTACAVEPQTPSTTNDDSVEATSTEESAIATDFEASGLVIKMTYYSSPDLTTVVGRCTIRSCPPKGTTCTGVKTDYFVKTEAEC